MVPPSDVCWFRNPMNTIVISAINHSEMGVMFTNLANKLGHIYGIYGCSSPYSIAKAPAPRRGHVPAQINRAWSRPLLEAHFLGTEKW